MKDETIKKIQDMVIKDMTNISNEIAILENKYNEFKELSEKEATSYQEFRAKRIGMQNEIDSENKFIADNKKEAEALMSKANAMVAEARDIQKSIQDEVTAGKKQLAEMASDISRLNEERRIRQEQELIAGNERIKELQKELEARVPLVHAKEKELKIKEEDLKTIENRWKKIYGEKGLSFKI